MRATLTFRHAHKCPVADRLVTVELEGDEAAYPALICLHPGPFQGSQLMLERTPVAQLVGGESSWLT